MYIRDIFGDDLPIIYELYSRDVYHLRNLSLPKEAVVFDVGAHIGSFPVAIHSIFPDAHITAFEPHPDNFFFLKKNAKFASCINVAVTSYEGEAHLGDHKAPSSYALGDYGILVKTVTLDSYAAAVSRIDLLKVDVEGAEKDIFEHITPSVLAKTNRIMMEIHPPHDSDWFVKLFKRNGFVVSVENDILFAERKYV